MNLNTEAELIEAILYLEVDPVDLKALQRISGLAREVVLGALSQLRETFEQDGHGL